MGRAILEALRQKRGRFILRIIVTYGGFPPLMTPHSDVILCVTGGIDFTFSLCFQKSGSSHLLLQCVT